VEEIHSIEACRKQKKLSMKTKPEQRTAKKGETPTLGVTGEKERTAGVKSQFEKISLNLKINNKSYKGSNRVKKSRVAM